MINLLYRTSDCLNCGKSSFVFISESTHKYNVWCMHCNKTTNWHDTEEDAIKEWENREEV